MLCVRVIPPLILGSLILLCNITAVAASSNFTVFPNNSLQYDIPYSELLAKWWVWWNAIPNDVHPAKNYPNIERCSMMQDEAVWFLPDVLPGVGKVNYSCNVPAGKDMILPISMTECNNGREGAKGDFSDTALKECAFNIETPHDRIIVLINGTRVDVSNIGAPIETDFFNVTYPESPVDIWGAGYIQPGVHKAIAQGYILIFHDMSPGKYKIDLTVEDKLKGRADTEPKREGTFDLSIQ